MKKQNEQAENKTPNIEFDAIWKAIITAFFPDFMAFFLPKLHHDIDYSYPHIQIKKRLVFLTILKLKTMTRTFDMNSLLIKLWLKKKKI